MATKAVERIGGLVLGEPIGGFDVSGGGGHHAVPEERIAELPFDFKAYKATITIGTDPVLHTIHDLGTDPAYGLQVDEDVAWASQWGKCVDITFRFWSDYALVGNIPARTVVAHIDGIGIVMGDYEQRVWLGYKSEENPGNTGGFIYFPFLLVSSNGTDWRAGYDLLTYDTFTIFNDSILSGNVNLITRTFFKGGEIHADAGDFS